MITEIYADVALTAFVMAPWILIQWIGTEKFDNYLFGRDADNE